MMMTEGLIQALTYTVPGAVVAALALQAAVSLSAAYAALRAKAAENNQPVPPLVAVYFRNAVRLLFVSAAFHLGLSGTDAVLAGLKVDAPAKLLGYAGALALLVCGFAVLLQGSVDKHLRLHPGRWRLVHTLAVVVGIAAAAWGMVIVTLHDRIWP